MTPGMTMLWKSSTKMQIQESHLQILTDLEPWSCLLKHLGSCPVVMFLLKEGYPPFRTRKWMIWIRILLSFGDGLFSGAMFVLGEGTTTTTPQKKHMKQSQLRVLWSLLKIGCSNLHQRCHLSCIAQLRSATLWWTGKYVVPNGDLIVLNPKKIWKITRFSTNPSRISL